jgi:hypothetical protein
MNNEGENKRIHQETRKTLLDSVTMAIAKLVRSAPTEYIKWILTIVGQGNMVVNTRKIAIPGPFRRVEFC